MKQLLVSFFLLACMCLCICNAEAQRPEYNTRLEPEPWKREVNYPDIVLNAGDVLYLKAGGCVQTGGEGLTWKRFVDPVGENSDRLYHGLVFIPGITSGLQRISSFLDRAITIPAGASGSLRLGYEDDPDDYGDNSYERHDNGIDNQCASGERAYVDIRIKYFEPPAQENGPPVSENLQGNPSDAANMPNEDKGKSDSNEFQPEKSKPFLETATGIIIAITAFIGAIVAFFKLFKKKT